MSVEEIGNILIEEHKEVLKETLEKKLKHCIEKLNKSKDNLDINSFLSESSLGNFSLEHNNRIRQTVIRLENELKNLDIALANRFLKLSEDVELPDYIKEFVNEEIKKEKMKKEEKA